MKQGLRRAVGGGVVKVVENDCKVVILSGAKGLHEVHDYAILRFTQNDANKCSFIVNGNIAKSSTQRGEEAILSEQERALGVQVRGLSY